MPQPYDALLVVSFGGPDQRDDVLPFLENVLRGRNVSRERMLEVAEHYYMLGGRSPINDQNRALIAAVERELAVHGPRLPVYWGNRNWHPLLADTVRQMAADGIERALAFVTSAFSSYSGCRQYRENIAAAQAQVGPAAPQIDKLRVFFNHPGFIEPLVEHTLSALDRVPQNRRADARLVFTAHSIPIEMAKLCRYELQLRDACLLVVQQLAKQFDPQDGAAPGDNWALVYQSRSGPPQQPWLEPDIKDFLHREYRARPFRDVVIVPIGFISDHMEVVYDLDTEARQVCDELGIHMIRATTVGTHPRFVRMIRELIDERTAGAPPMVLGALGPSHDNCPEDCCLYVPRRS
jgi:ferrochelatase